MSVTARPGGVLFGQVTRGEPALVAIVGPLCSFGARPGGEFWAAYYVLSFSARPGGDIWAAAPEIVPPKRDFLAHDRDLKQKTGAQTPTAQAGALQDPFPDTLALPV